MTKAKAARAQLPGQPSDAEPTTTDATLIGGSLKPPVFQAGEAEAPVGFVRVDAAVTTEPPLDPALGTASALPPVEPGPTTVDAAPLGLPPVDPLPPEPRLPPVLAAFTRLEQVRSLPEVVGEIETQPVEFAPGSIQRFKASDTDRRTLEVIALPGMGFAVRAVTTEEA